MSSQTAGEFGCNTVARRTGRAPNSLNGIRLHHISDRNTYRAGFRHVSDRNTHRAGFRQPDP